jgi:ribosomal protein S27E
MTDVLEDIVSTAERGSNLRLHVRCPECRMTGVVPTAWERLNIRCRNCGIHFYAVADQTAVPPIRAHNFKQEEPDGKTSRRDLLVRYGQRAKNRGTAA